jgi:hypothetical protein
MVENPPKQPLVALVTLVPSSITSSSNWRIPFIKYLTDGTGYMDKMENKRLVWCRKHYLLVDGVLMHKNIKEEILM